MASGRGIGLLERTGSIIEARRFGAREGEPSESFTYKLAALHDLSVELSLAVGIDELSERAVALGRKVLGFDRIGIWFADPDDPSFLKGSFDVDGSGRVRDKRGLRLRRPDHALSADFYEGKEPVYFIGQGPCFGDGEDAIGEADRALALLWNGRKVIGEVQVDNLLTKRPIGGGELDLLVRYARIVGFLASFKLEQAELGKLSEIDELTGAVNRRTAMLFLEKQLGLAARGGSALSIAFIDLDGLKAVNDSLGHAAGDEYIRAACGVLAKAIRTTDTLGRLGGDEFLAILPSCDADGARATGARVRALAEERNRASASGFRVSLSLGFATSSELEPAEGAALASRLVELADERMYRDKIGRKASRN